MAKAVVKGAGLGRYLALGAALSALLVAGLSLKNLGGSPASTSVHNGSAGLKHTQHGVDVRWRLAQTKVYLDASLDTLGDDAREAVTEAFSTWASVDGQLPQLEFEGTRRAVLSAKPDGKNTVLVAPITVKGHEHDLAITLTYSDERSGDIVEADIIINAEYPFRTLKSDDDGIQASAQSSGDGQSALTSDSGQQPTVSAARASCTATAQRASCQGNAYDLQNVMTHEVGHFFGLGEDMEDSATTMYYCTSRCETHKRVLTVSDTQVMASLYAAPPEERSGPQGGCGGARVAPRGGLAEAGWAALLGLLVFARRRRSNAVAQPK